MTTQIERQLHGADDRAPARYLPVLDDGRLVGVVSMRDLVRDIISEQRQIEQLQHYIAGSSG